MPDEPDEPPPPFETEWIDMGVGCAPLVAFVLLVWIWRR